MSMRLIISIIILLDSLGLNAQSIVLSRQVIGAYGSSHTLTNMVIMDNVGEVAITTESSNNLVLTQGFEQPSYSVGLDPTFNPPNAFSPDGDGTNDNWILPLNTDIQQNKVTIFNRWGDIVKTFENYNNLDIVWDGNNQDNQEVVDGTYFYVIEFPLNGRSNSGWVQVVRHQTR